MKALGSEVMHLKVLVVLVLVTVLLANDPYQGNSQWLLFGQTKQYHRL